MSSDDTHGGTAVAARRPTPVALALRPLGYLFMTLLWTVFSLIAALLGPGSIAWLYLDRTMTFGARLADLSVFEWIGAVVVMVPILAAVMGAGAMFYVPTMAWPLAVLNLVYVGRSLRPSYARERLSGTVWARSGTSLGPPTLGPVAMSSLPVRGTRITDVLMTWYQAGWVLHRDTFRAALPAGLGWVCFFAWTMRDLSDVTRGVLATVGSALVVVSIVLVWREMRRRLRRHRHGEPSPLTGSAAVA